jgi:hypothetical protein
VVDNFLKKKAFKKPKTNISITDGGVKFYKTEGKAKYFNKTVRPEDSESDILLSVDEDVENGPRYRGSDNPLVRAVSESDGGSSSYSLLSHTVT